MKTIEEFLSYLCSLDVKLWVENNRLRCNAPKDVLTPVIKKEIAERKEDILTFLRNNSVDFLAGKQPIHPVKRQENLPLSFAQQRLWFLAQLEPDSSFYNLSAAIRLQGQLNVEALQQSFNEIISRHEALRTNFQTTKGQAVAVISKAKPLTLQISDISKLSASQKEAEVRQQASQEAQKPFDLKGDLLLRVKLLYLGKEEHILLLTMHHIVFDGWSTDVLVQELATLYQAFCDGQPSPLPPLLIQYVDFAAWQRQWLQGEVLETQLSYWRKHLEDAPKVLELPTDHPRPAIQTFLGTTYSFELSKELSASLNKLSQQQGSTLFMTLLAAFQTLLWRYTGQEDIVIGSPIANRNRPEIEGLIGFFVNTLVLRTSLAGNPSFEELLKRVREVALGAYAHQDLPFELLVEQLQPQRDLSHTPLFQVMFVLQNAPMSALELPGLTLTPIESDSGAAQFDLTLSMTESESGLVSSLEYNTDLFKSSSIQRMAAHLQTLLEAIVANPQQCLSQLPLLTESEKHQLLWEWNNTKVEYPQDQCIHQLFEAQVEHTPDAVAVVFEDQQLTYWELNARANQLAHYLRSLGVKPEVLVGICVERSLSMIIGLLAILKAGGAYVPLDPSYPQERLAYMLEDSQPSVLLTQQYLLENIPNHQAQVICIDSDWEKIATESTENPISNIKLDNLAYVIYTSGSTGKPKGAMNAHSGILNRLLWMQDTYQLTSKDAVLQKTPFSFDVSVWEFFWTLMTGARLVIAQPEGHKDTNYLVNLIAQQQITTLHFVPSMLQVFVEAEGLEKCQSLVRVIASGEALLTQLQQRFFNRLDAQLHNLYGPTEAAVDVTFWQCEKDGVTHQNTVPIGQPIANIQIYLLDQYLNPVPVGVTGEVYIGGVGVGRGYLNRPELTAEKFIPNPFIQQTERLYKTGDKARYLANGEIKYIGRIDNQVKLRGFRIELGEIEAIISQYPAVRETVVGVREDSADSQRIVAYVVPQEEQTLTIPELRSFLESKLPSYMIPAAFVTLEALPLTPNGKVDRKALPAPDTARLQLETVYQPPQTEVEQKIANTWQEVLNIENIGIYDNFFELGGHSLLLIQVHSKLQTIFPINLLILDLFRYPTISSLAEFLSRANNNEPSSSDQTDTRNQQLTDGKNRIKQFLTTHPEFSHKGLEIAIIGMVGRFPGAKNLDEFWQNLQNGEESIAAFTDEELISSGIDPTILNDPQYVRSGAVLEDVEFFDASFFGFNPREAEIIDPQQRLFLECASEALESAGYDSKKYKGLIGVYAGAGMNSYMFNLYSNQNIINSIDDFQLLVASDKDFLTTRVSYKLELEGPSVDIQTACSTSLVAVHFACRSLLGGECDIALAGGVAISASQKSGYFYQEGGILSPDGHCRAFDAEAQGTVPGNGVGIVVLKRLEDALADGDCIHAVIKGSAINNDGAFKVSYTAPRIDTQAKVIRATQTIAEVDPETITYIEAHGTGTPLGDPIEIAALTQAFRASTQKKGFCAIGSVKTNIGHLDTAAGVSGLIKTVLALKHKQIPPSLHFKQPNPQIDFDNSPFYVNNKLSEWKANGTPRRAGVSSFGIGGTNAHVILEEAPPTQASSLSRPWQLLLLCAKTDSALETATTNLVTHLKQHPDSNLADVAYTLQVGRREFEHRRMLLCQNFDDAVTVLENLDSQRIFNNFQQPCNRQTVFMFPGQGSQYVNMGRELYETESVFRKHIDKCCEILKPHLGVDLRTILYPDEEKTEVATQQLQQTHITQPALFVIEYALAELWMAWGISPMAMIGHSIGEYVAATLADVFSLEDALALVATRGRLMQQIPSGAMLSVALSEEAIQSCLDENLSLASLNAPSSCVVSGSKEAIDQLQQELQQAGVSCRSLHTSHAFHSQMMSPVIETFTQSLQKIKLNPPKIPFVSNVSGTWITIAQATDPNYWAKHLRQPVRFSQGVTELLKQPEQILLEVGPGKTLSSLAKQHQMEELIALTSIRHPQEQQSDVAFLLNTLGKLWLVGVQINWSNFYVNEKRHRVPLPTYPFERQRYWVEVNQNATSAMMSQKTLDKKPDITDWFYVPRWKESTPLELLKKGELLEQKSCWLVFVDTYGVGAEIAEQLRQKEQDVVTVGPGEQFTRLDDHTYTINPQQKDDYNALLQALQEQDWKPQEITHFWSITPDDSLPHQELDGQIHLKRQFFEDCQSLGLYSLVFLAQALGQQNITEPIKLMVVTSNVHDVTGSEILCPEKATILSPCKVIPQEYPNISCCCFDIVLADSRHKPSQKHIDYLLAEFTAQLNDNVIAYRGNHRWVQTYEPIRLNENITGKTRLREKGVYLITGGLGGVGLVLAEYLAKTVQAKLVLLGRKGLPEKDQWQEWLETHDEEDSISRKIRKVQEIETLGAEVLAIAADVANEEQMQKAIAKTSERFGKINGVIYAAGNTEEAHCAIEETSQSLAQLQFNSKVFGIFVLEKVLQQQDLDFCQFTSSLASILGGLGFISYSAANIFMDAYIQKYNQNKSCSWISVNWDGWEIKEQQNIEIEANLSKYSITSQAGVEVFERLLKLNEVSQVLVSTSDLEARIQQWIKLESLRNKDFSNNENSSFLYSRGNLQTDYVPARNQIEEIVAKTWEKALGIEKIGIHDNFFDLGGDSLISVQVISQLQKELNVQIPVVSIYNRPTISSLVEIISGDENEKNLGKSSLDRGKKRREKKKQHLQILKHNLN